ncbi:MAG: general secretion pathway protein G [Chitinophagales bacterium]|jgi:general secretion pathway protein G|tara:strand:+ start:2936 stop:3382 length:447 start_codon:yes stop_codon:yes gene_type:complete
MLLSYRSCHASVGQKGFTLIEIMVVIVILGLLAAIVAPSVMDRPDQARAIRVAQDVKGIESALKLYRLDNYGYPQQGQGLKSLVDNSSGLKTWKGPYLDSMPEDPWGNDYHYSNPGKHGMKVEVYSYGDDNAEGGEDGSADIGSWNIK